MEVEEIDNHALDGIDHGIPMKVVSCQCQAPFDIVEVECTDLLLFFRQAHNRIVEQCHRPLHTIITMWCGYFDKLRCNINHIQLEVFALTDTFHQIATAYNQTLTSLQPVYIIIIGELTETLVAIGMTQVASHLAPADAGQCI